MLFRSASRFRKCSGGIYDGHQHEGVYRTCSNSSPPLEPLLRETCFMMPMLARRRHHVWITLPLSYVRPNLWLPDISSTRVFVVLYPNFDPDAGWWSSRHFKPIRGCAVYNWSVYFGALTNLLQTICVKRRFCRHHLDCDVTTWPFQRVNATFVFQREACETVKFAAF